MSSWDSNILDLKVGDPVTFLSLQEVKNKFPLSEDGSRIKFPQGVEPTVEEYETIQNQPGIIESIEAEDFTARVFIPGLSHLSPILCSLGCLKLS